MTSNKTQIGTCKDCRWWSSKIRDAEFPNLRYCLMTRQNDPACNNAFYAYYLDDGDEQDAYLETGPDFGCIHFEDKNTDKEKP